MKWNLYCRIAISQACSVREKKSFAKSVRHATTAKYEPKHGILALRCELHGARPGEKCTNSSAKVVQRHPKVKFKDSALKKRFIRSPFSGQGNNVISHPETPARSQNTWGFTLKCKRLCSPLDKNMQEEGLKRVRTLKAVVLDKRVL